MAPSIKLAVISKMDWEASLLGNQLVFLHFLYILVEKQPYLMSTSSYKLSNTFIHHVHPILMFFTKIT